MPFIRRGAALGVQAASAQLRAALDAAAARGVDCGGAAQELDAALEVVLPLLPAAQDDDF